MKKFTVKLKLEENILGTCPSESIWEKYVRSKAPENIDTSDEALAIKTGTKIASEQAGMDEKGMTIFMRDPKTKKPVIMNYLIKGFFKNACNAMRMATKSKTGNLSSYKKKIDNLVFISPRMIPFETEDGSDIEIGVCERPLRASTPQGERVAIACSEEIPAGVTLTFDITLFDDKLYDMVLEWLDYGAFNGLGQWHNSGKGTFSYEIIK